MKLYIGKAGEEVRDRAAWYEGVDSEVDIAFCDRWCQRKHEDDQKRCYEQYPAPVWKAIV